MNIKKKGERKSMKTKKLFAMGLAGVTAVTAFAGCGTKSEATLPEEPAKLANYAAEQSRALDSYEMKSTINLAGEAMGQTESITASYNLVYFKNPMKMKMSMDMIVGRSVGEKNMSQKVNAEMYFMQDGDSYVVYTGENSTGEMEWTKMTIDPKDEKYKKAFDMMQNGGTDVLKGYEDCFKKNADKDTEEAIALSATVGVDKMKEIYEKGKNSMGDQVKEKVDDVESQWKAYGISIDKMIEGMGDISADITVDKETGCYKSLSIDAKKPAQAVLDAVMDVLTGMMAAYSDEAIDYKATVDKCNMDVEYLNYNKATDFEIPKEAKDAKEVDADGTTSIFSSDEE